MKKSAEQTLNDLIARYSQLAPCRPDVLAAFDILAEMYRSGGHHLLVCGNGGSAADSEHIVGELMKTFKIKRSVPDAFKEKASAMLEEKRAEQLCSNLEGALPAISLVSQCALFTAFGNDKNASYVFAQQVFGYGLPGDALLAISTSGNSENVIAAADVARIIGMSVIALTGEKPSHLSEKANVTIRVPETETYKIQELHLPVYHALCAALEAEMFEEE